MPTPIELLPGPVSVTVFDVLIFRDVSSPLDKQEPAHAISQLCS